jgi:hypothetical protein
VQPFGNFLYQLSFELKRISDFGSGLSKKLSEVTHPELNVYERDLGVKNLTAWSQTFAYLSALAHDWAVCRITKEEFEQCLPWPLVEREHVFPPGFEMKGISPRTTEILEEEKLFLTVALGNCSWCIASGLMTLAEVEAEMAGWSNRQRFWDQDTFEQLRQAVS